jgi:uncharacterized protein (DUF362 family)
MEIKNKPLKPVAVVRTTPNSILEDVQRVMELANWRRFITPGANIALKPNLGWDKLIPGAVSAPWVVEAVIQTIRPYVGEIYLVESDQVVVKADRALALTGLDKICKHNNVTWVNMSKGQFVQVSDPERLVLKQIWIPEILTKTELITLPLLKTHNKTQISGALKNQWGCLETLRHNYHLVLPEALVDVNTIVRPRFALMDGTVALEGNGPKSGIPKEMNVLLASGNLVGIDAIAARIMGLIPEKIKHITLCADHGLGTLSGLADVIGEDINALSTPFKPASHNAVSRLELAFRRSRIEHLVFQTPLLLFFCWGTRRYYDLWDLTVGRGIRKRFNQSSAYSKQWQ